MAQLYGTRPPQDHDMVGKARTSPAEASFALALNAARLARVALHLLLSLVLLLGRRTGAHALVLLALGSRRLSLLLTTTFGFIGHEDASWF
jgi:hypothetical protein